MKTKICLLALAGVTAAVTLIPRQAEAQPPAAKTPPVESPVGLECVVSVEIQAWMDRPLLQPAQQSGFFPDYTLRGKIVELGPEGVVLKDGNFENWISRDKVLSIRVTRN
ncbi:MAG TPA: hypothetical protein VM511_06855 [Luteolibacter sp.]|nr:hypothetical protein [Luteolibacter sp.]